MPHQELFGFEYKRLHDAPYSIYADDDKYSAFLAERDPDRAFSIIGAWPHESLAMLRRDRLKLIRLARGSAEPLYELYDMNDKEVPE